MIGDAAVLLEAWQIHGANSRLQQIDDLEELDSGGVGVVDTTGETEPVEVAAIRRAVEWMQAGRAAGLVTGPIHKHKLSGQGFAFRGHTDFLGHLAGVERPVMAFVGGRLRVCLVTVHLPLREVADALSVDQILHTSRLALEALRRDVGIERPRLIVCGLNPHAGDGGLLGAEETEIIEPAVQQLRDEGCAVVGPVSAEAAFRFMLDGKGDMVMAMYHDQGLAPLKLVDFGQSVNWTLGLPFIRTSVDHGTAYDLVGTGRADPGSFCAALEWAETLSASRA